HYEIASPASFISSVVWSPDSQKAFIFGRAQCDSHDQLWLLENQKLTLVSSDVVSPLTQSYNPPPANEPLPIWSPQSDKGVIQKDDGKFYQVDLSTLHLTPLALPYIVSQYTDEVWMTWSPDGNHLYVSKDPTIYDVDFKAQKVEELLN